MKNSLLVILTLVILPRTCEGEEIAADKTDKEAGIVTPHSRGLHGYIGYSASRPPGRADYSAGMGFYSAVWPLIEKPIARFQIGLPSAWITPNNSDNKDTPLAPVGTLARDNWPERGPTWGSVFQTVEFDVPKSGEREVKVRLTKACDYGIFQLYLDEKKVGQPIDLYDPDVVPTDATSLGRHKLIKGKHTLRAAAIGCNKKVKDLSVGTCLFGLDYMTVK